MGFPLIPFFESNVLSSVDVNNRRTAILVVAFVKAGIYADSTMIRAFFDSITSPRFPPRSNLILIALGIGMLTVLY
jgi:hypothetical protein